MRYFNIDPDTRLAVAETDTHSHPNDLGIMGHWLAAGPDLATGDVYCEGDALVPLPPRPGPWAVFDPAVGVWRDPRGAAEIAAQLAADRRAAVEAINAAAGRLRRVYVTDLPGQDALYLLKQDEARRWLTADAPALTVFPLIAAEVGITAPSGDEVAQVYANLAVLYLEAAARLETARLYHIARAEAAPSAEAAVAAAAAFAAAIAAMEGGPA